MDSGEIELPFTGNAPKMGGRWVKYVMNNKSFGAFIKSEQARGVTTEVAHDIATRAGELAPRRKDGKTPEGEAMADRFEVKREAGFMKVAGNVRVCVEVFNSARSAAPMEFGNVHVKGHRMLGRAGAEHGDFHAKKGLG